ncbi:M48 family metallopeptidase [Puniceibacterium sp. IMCC21224]|uniref:M48 family metallopeptidase n=1 Tax=Puniceibacterium sp. IMCC21224 TaxID=1618204 RepID=UPI00065D5B38|nr:M48 family metallopeptidase [Puniceibacterium sp. IMCC21224]KMK66083.1 Peptidase family M48 [Puniceibacterium sp. IMCC21224]
MSRMAPPDTVIRVGGSPARFHSQALFLDGTRPEPREVTLAIDEDRATLVSGVDIDWPLRDIREVPDQAGGDLFVLRLRDDPLQRLILPDRSLAPRLPRLRRRAPVTRRGRLLVWAGAAIASVALIVLVLVPLLADRLAAFVPPAGERALGEVTLNQIRDALDESGLSPVPVCDSAPGLAALNKIRSRLTAAQDPGQPLSVHVLGHDMVNAFALPGGYVVLFDGLIQSAESPEEVAAVLAHEIGHVVSRDPTRHALRSAGSIGVLGLLFGDFAGGAVVLFLAERLIQASYSQEAEAAADLFAHQMLRDAALPPDALAQMFERFRAMGGGTSGLIAHFLSHPDLGDRIAAARRATPEGFEAATLLSPQHWQTLRAICD